MPFLVLCCESEAILSKKISSLLPGLECSHGKIFIPAGYRSRDLGNRALGFSYEQMEMLTKERVTRRDLGNRASPVDWAQTKGP